MSNVSLPTGWCATAVGNIAEVVAGGTPKAGEPKNFAEPGNGVPWLTPADLSGYKKKYIAHGARDLSQSGYDSSSAKLIPAGSLLFSSRAPIGYVAVASNPISTNQGFKNFVFYGDIDSSYAYYYLRSIRGIAESLGTGTTFKEISGATAKTLPFVLPPLAEQQEIAARLDTLLAQVDTIKGRLDALPAILKRFRQSVLAAAVSGKLTEKWRMREGLLLTSWIPHEVKDIAKVIDPNPSHRYPPPEEGGIPILSTQQFVGDSGWTTEKAKLISREFFIERNEKCGFFERDIIFARKGRLGLPRFAPSGYEYVYSHTVFIIRPEPKTIDAEFLLWSLRPDSVVDYLLMTMNSNTGVPTLGKSVFEKMEIQVPSIIEQAEIVRRVEQLFAFADQVEQRVKDAQSRVNHLTQSILAKAFRGELTADWRQQHPELISGEHSAEALLARIQAERAAQAPAKRTRKQKASA